MSNAAARRASSRPIRPKPTTPRVLPLSSAPRRPALSQTPAFICASARATERARVSIRAQACSATLTLVAPGAFSTSTPRALAASRSTLSTPVPARATTRRRGAAARTPDVTRVALRTMRPSASARSAASVSARPAARSTTVQPSARSRSAAEAGSRSAMTIFMTGEPARLDGRGLGVCARGGALRGTSHGPGLRRTAGSDGRSPPRGRLAV